MLVLAVDGGGGTTSLRGARAALGPDFSVAPTSRIPTGPRDARHIPTATEGRAAYPYGYSFGPVRRCFLLLRRKIYGLTGAAGENFAVSTACISYCSCSFATRARISYGYACPPDVSPAYGALNLEVQFVGKVVPTYSFRREWGR